MTKIVIMYNKRFCRANSYGAKKTKIYDRCFASAGEAAFYLKLLEEEKLGLIKDIKLQHTIEIVPGIKWRADFFVYDNKTQEYVLKEFKGFETEVWLLKKKLLYLFSPFRTEVWVQRNKRENFTCTEIIQPRTDSYCQICKTFK